MEQINLENAGEERVSRISERQVRLRRRLNAAKRLKSVLETPANVPSSLEMTIDESNEKLFKTFLEGKELVTNIRVSSDTKELIRRDAESAARAIRLKALDDEASLALEKINNITSKWEVLGKFNDPLDLSQELKDQRMQCEALIQQKDDIIQSLKIELKLADERFVNDRSDMLEDISILARRIDEQVSIMKKSYLEEMKHIEDAVDDSRLKIFNKENYKWEFLYNKKEVIEVNNLDEKFAIMESNEEEVSNVHIAHSEKYRETKIRLDTNVQNLEQELEQIKAVCLVNSEKLDYNYQVLKKREDENIIVKNNQRRNLNRLQGEVFKLKRDIELKDEITNQEIKHLDKDLSRLQKNIVDVEKKADHFCVVNDQKFQQIWDMKTDEAMDLLNKIFAADKEIHEEVLGLIWVEPALKPLKKEDLISFQAASAMILQIFQPSVEIMASASTIDESSDHKSLVKRILDLISENSGFLIEEKLEDILKPYSTDERTLVRLDNVFNAIGVKKQGEIEIMQSFFLPYAICSLCSAENSGDDPCPLLTAQCMKDQHPFVIEKPNVLKALREFVTKLNASNLSKWNANDIHLAKDRCTMTRWISHRDIEKYWIRFREIFQPESEQLWDALYTGLTKYHSILQEREKLQNKAHTLTQQNMELRRLVDKYFPIKSQN